MARRRAARLPALALLGAFFLFFLARSNSSKCPPSTILRDNCSVFVLYYVQKNVPHTSSPTCCGCASVSEEPISHHQFGKRTAQSVRDGERIAKGGFGHEARGTAADLVSTVPVCVCAESKTERMTRPAFRPGSPQAGGSPLPFSHPGKETSNLFLSPYASSLLFPLATFGFRGLFRTMSGARLSWMASAALRRICARSR